MDRLSLLRYLEGQLPKIDQEGFNLKVWKESLSHFFDKLFGKGNAYSSQIRNLEFEEKMSVEELYPKKVIDLESSFKKFKAVINEIIDQVRILDEAEFNTGKSTTNSTLEVVINAMRFHLRGGQLKEMADVSTKSKDADQQENIVKLIKSYDVEIVQNILAEILTSKEIWQNLKT